MTLKTHHPLYSVWAAMKHRCLNKNGKYWSYYGGRGITVCDRWLGKEGFINFLQDMGPRPERHTLDRINNNSGYSPDNCRWATRSEQQLNRRITVILTIEGKEYFLAHLAKLSGMKPDSIKNRALQGLTYEQVMSPERRIFTEGLSLGGKANGAKNRAKTHCKYGHEFTPENTAPNGIDGRACRKCHADREHAKRQAKKYAL